MPFNFNHGWGRMIADSLAARWPHIGKVFIVSASTLKNWEELTEMFPGGPEGKTRVYSTLQGAIDDAEDSGHDVIFIAPEHSETVTAAAGLSIGTTKTGLTIIGLGSGNKRPTINFTTATTADFDVNSEGVTFENIIFDLTGVDALAAPLDINDAYCTFRNCEFITADSGGQTVVGILTDANAGGLKLENCYFYGSDNAGTKSAVRIVGGVEHVIDKCHFIGNYKITAGAIQVTTTAAGLLVRDTTILNRTAASVSAIDLVKNTTTVIVGCVLGVKTGTTPVTISEGAITGADGGYVLVGRNYYNAASTVVAGTLL